MGILILFQFFFFFKKKRKLSGALLSKNNAYQNGFPTGVVGREEGDDGDGVSASIQQQLDQVQSFLI